MSSRITENPATEIKTEIPDIQAFEGRTFTNSMCQCGRHLAMASSGLCTICQYEHEIEHGQKLEFDPELSDILNGQGSHWSW